MTDNLRKILSDMEGIMGDMVTGQKLQNTFNSQLITLLQEISARTLVMSGVVTVVASDHGVDKDAVKTWVKERVDPNLQGEDVYARIEEIVDDMLPES
ncbi:MAG: hypothetical protein CMM50_12655 [Rhodospirillaceae bacterium]|nr:hypothetical protein [Rhodospirillaceae bacterium]|tara:strand:- start:271 stop:564 length:294 start_codon:yes stop_codon:yes gene_type:complete